MKHKKRLPHMLVFALSGVALPVNAAELVTDAQAIVPATEGKIPQAPRVAPNGAELTFEVFSPKEKTSDIWRAQSDGTSAACLTCAWSPRRSYENAYWHPTGELLVFNELATGSARGGGIIVAQYKDGRLTVGQRVAQGARPQFSSPSGHVIFFETPGAALSYRLLGSQPLSPIIDFDVELRGPINRVNEVADVSHPSLASDGTTIVFAARTTSLEADGTQVLDDAARQRLYFFWRQSLTANEEDIKEATAALLEGERDPRDLSKAEVQRLVTGKPGAKLKFAPKFTELDLGRAFVLGLLEYRQNDDDAKVREILFPRLWTTDVFGAPITPLVKNLSSAPLPQKWATISRDGLFAVFEAGLFTNRQIYLITKKNGQWMDRAIKITEKGTYNSSPELDPKGEMLYFESNRGGKSAIWRAKLDWNQIDARLANVGAGPKGTP